jgi:hypothetical protein
LRPRTARTRGGGEIDFFAIELTPRESTSCERCTSVVIGEAKDRGSSIDANDAEGRRCIPAWAVQGLIVFAKLSAFTDDETAVAAALSQDWQIKSWHPTTYLIGQMKCWSTTGKI